MAIKIKEDQSKKIDEFQQKYNQLIGQIGQLEFQITDAQAAVNGMHNAKKQVLDNYAAIKKEEREFLEALQKEYGAGNIDLATKTFHPAEPQPQLAPKEEVTKVVEEVTKVEEPTDK